MAGLGGRLAAAGQRRGRHRPCLRLDAGGWGEQALFLAGGIHPGNAADAVRRLRPYAVDASSGVETNGYKDGEKMRALVRAVREASGAAPGGLTE